jgi:hypothetical protein
MKVFSERDVTLPDGQVRRFQQWWEGRYDRKTGQPIIVQEVEVVWAGDLVRYGVRGGLLDGEHYPNGSSWHLLEDWYLRECGRQDVESVRAEAGSDVRHEARASRRVG